MAIFKIPFPLLSLPFLMAVKFTQDVSPTVAENKIFVPSSTLLTVEAAGQESEG